MKPVVQNFDLKAYLGQWFEIARIPNLWEPDCCNATAMYTMDSQHRICVENICFDQDGKELRSVIGEAWQVEPNSGKLMVKFAFGQDLNQSMKPEPYWVHATDYKNYAIVGGPDDRYLWILSRTSEIPKCSYQHLCNLSELMGYDVKRLEVTQNSLIECSKCFEVHL